MHKLTSDSGLSAPKRVCGEGRELLPVKQDIFNAPTNWHNLEDGGSEEVYFNLYDADSA